MASASFAPDPSTAAGRPAPAGPPRGVPGPPPPGGAPPAVNEMPAAVPRPNNLDAFWMPYTDNRYFKSNPRMLARAEGMSYFTPEGREILDGTAGLWCCNAGHGRREIKEAIQRQA